jgi:hypothetical protein
MSYDSKLKFGALTENSKYIRVCEKHPLELYLGLDAHGNKTLRLNERFEPLSVKSSAKITIQQIKFDGYNSILFTNTGDEVIFYQFCNDLINTSRICEQHNGYQFLLNRYAKWKKMFAGNKDALSLTEIMGLIGELSFLKDYTFGKYGISNAVLGWSGQEPTHKDFSYGDCWYEIKSIDTHKNTVTVSSVEQLDSVNEGVLVVYRLEKMSASFNGVSLNNLVTQIKRLITDEEALDVFENKLLQAKYIYLPSYDEIVFCLTGREAYQVPAHFPRLKRNELPSQIAGVKYELLINSIEEFKIKL